MMHMTFYWGKEATILFPGWKTSTWLNYSFSLVLLFVVSVFYQYLSRLRTSSPSTNPNSSYSTPLLGRTSKFSIRSSKKILDSVIFGISVGIAYLLMLAVMCFNGGVFIAVVLGFTVGFYLFRSEASSTSTSEESDPCACS